MESSFRDRFSDWTVGRAAGSSTLHRPRAHHMFCRLESRTIQRNVYLRGYSEVISGLLITTTESLLAGCAALLAQNHIPTFVIRLGHNWASRPPALRAPQALQILVCIFIVTQDQQAGRSALLQAVHHCFGSSEPYSNMLKPQ